jgi:SOS-response transcriptional repressor LexA
MTRRQAQLLDFIRARLGSDSVVSPSYEEMRVELGLRSLSGVHRLVERLVVRGFIERRPGCARSIRLTSEPGTDIEKLEQAVTRVCDSLGAARARTLLRAHLSNLRTAA